MKFHNKLTDWYLVNARDLPWRETQDPYPIWLSEIMLQQTRINQGLPYFFKFMEAFPTVFDLAGASEDKVLKLWQGLGYYSRARNLHFTAKYVAHELNGVFPTTYKELKQLKGVGDYTASAIASFCYQEPVAVVDGNVYRVLSRYFGIDTPINSTEGIKEFKSLAEKLLDKKQPHIYNQAIMEFGALQCSPKSPDCDICPLQVDCVAFQQNSITALPRKLKKTKVQERNYNYIVVVDKEGQVLLEKRTGKGIWKNLYQFPLIESTKTCETLEDLISFNDESLPQHILEEASLYNEKPIKHVLSHRKLWVSFWIVEVEKLKLVENLSKSLLMTNQIDTFAVPVVIEKFIDAYGFSE
ncbi:A/G-specific adenine glycosylase [Mesonia sp. MT50]|uniref:Adenine DNA glycosylase n=1 Tax=Mesonia profundi TaxID=3070998 RepID=A0ABU1A4M0_9FLAO|nr:A/G-specific adenine glycosylase [Mesonia profundi]MDQ7918648.1 A/G-specific adenine glycosylase [Mesonia profundi]